LFDLGCTGIVTDSHETSLKVFFPPDTNSEDISCRLRRFLEDLADIFPNLTAPGVRFSRVPQQNWEQDWKRFFNPVLATSRLMVIPHWENPPPSYNGRVIRMEPGPAFGTGRHATTQLCLEVMERLPVTGDWSLLDVGTGSGILAVYGSLIGAQRIIGLDTDVEALRWAERNVSLNSLSAAVHFSSLSIRRLRETFTVVVANIVRDELVRISSHLRECVENGGWLILSGILAEQERDLLKAFEVDPFRHMWTLGREEWICIALERKQDR
jgi:ribosomal protein L11 methyltransferase